MQGRRVPREAGKGRGGDSGGGQRGRRGREKGVKVWGRGGTRRQREGGRREGEETAQPSLPSPYHLVARGHAKGLGSRPAARGRADPVQIRHPEGTRAGHGVLPQGCLLSDCSSRLTPRQGSCPPQGICSKPASRELALSPVAL